MLRYDLDGRSTPPEGLKAIGICSGETFSCGLSPVPGYKSPRMQGTPVCWGGDQYRIVRPPDGSPGQSRDPSAHMHPSHLFIMWVILQSAQGM